MTFGRKFMNKEGNIYVIERGVRGQSSGSTVNDIGLKIYIYL